MQLDDLWITDASGVFSTNSLPYGDGQLSISRTDSVLLIEALLDSIELRVRPTVSGIEVEVTGKRYKLPLPSQHVLHIRTGDGNDQVIVESALDCRLVIETRAGADDIHLGDYSDEESERTGNVMVDAGPDNDRIVALGPKKVEIDGGPGDDTISSSADLSMLYAGSGKDTVKVEGGRAIIEAMSGMNSISTGRLDDRLFGHSDSLHAIDGYDAPLLLEARHTALPTEYAETFEIQGDSAYVEKVTRLINMLRGTLSASTLLDDLVAKQAKVVIRNTSTLTNAHTRSSGFLHSPNVINGQRGTALLHCVIEFNPLAQALDLPSPVILYHELCHAWNLATGSRLGDGERQAVGLDSGEQPFDFDDDPTTPPTATNPDPFNENALRHELGLPPRLTYP